MTQKRAGHSGWHQATRKSFDLFNDTKIFPHKKGLEKSVTVLNRLRIKFFKQFICQGGHYAD